VGSVSVEFRILGEDGDGGFGDELLLGARGGHRQARGQGDQDLHITIFYTQILQQKKN